MTDSSTVAARSRAAAALVAVVAVAGIGLTGCGGSDVEHDRVVVVGDSILQMSTASVEGALRADGWVPAVRGVFGSTIRGGPHSGFSWPDTVHRLVTSRHPAVAVVELGTNDADPRVCCGRVPASIDAVMEQLRAVPHVLWLNVQEGRTDSADAERVNADLRAATRRWSNLRIVDFSERFTGHPDWHSGPGPHLTPAGQVAFAQLIAQAVAPWAPSRAKK